MDSLLGIFLGVGLLKVLWMWWVFSWTKKRDIVSLGDLLNYYREHKLEKKERE